MGLAITRKTVFGHGFDVQLSSETKSGFEPVKKDFRSGEDFFGDLRLKGFSSLLRLGFAEQLVLVSGIDHLWRYDGTVAKDVIHEAELIREMLIEDYKISPDQVAYLKSEPHTSGNVNAIKSFIEDQALVINECAMVTNHYHVPRAWLSLHFANFLLPIFAAEAFLIIEDSNCTDYLALLSRFGGGPLAGRSMGEICGIADMIEGTYKPRNQMIETKN